MEARSQRWQRTMRHLWLPENRAKIIEQAMKFGLRDVGIAWWALTLIGLMLILDRWTYDDPYITYRYARNLLSGQGLVYNAGQHILSTTAPLYAVLLAGLGALSPNLPAVSSTLSAAALLASAALLFKWGQRNHELATGMVAALLLSLSPVLLMTFGAETCLSVMLILAGFYTYDRSHLNLAAAALALAAMVRPDAFLAATALGLYHLIRRRPTKWQPLAIYLGLAGSWYAGLWIYYGSPMPVTLLAKQHQGQMAISTRFGAGLVQLLGQLGRQPLYWLHGVLALLGLRRVAKRARHWTPLLIWSALYLLTYTALGVSQYFWYYAPLMPALAVLVAEGSVALARLLARTRLPQAAVVGTTVLLLTALVAPLLSGVLWIGWQSDPQLDVYREIGQWLEANTPEETSVGALEVGIIGYYAQRPMVGFAGLIQPDVARQLTPTSTYEESTAWAIQTYQPDYVVLHSDASYSPVRREWFQETYRPVRNFSAQGTLWVTLYQRSPSR